MSSRRATPTAFVVGYQGSGEQEMLAGWYVTGPVGHRVELAAGPPPEPSRLTIVNLGTVLLCLDDEEMPAAIAMHVDALRAVVSAASDLLEEAMVLTDAFTAPDLLDERQREELDRDVRGITRTVFSLAEELAELAISREPHGEVEERHLVNAEARDLLVRAWWVSGTARALRAALRTGDGVGED